MTTAVRSLPRLLPGRIGRPLLMLAAAAGINLALLVLAGYLVNASRAPEQDITVPVGVNLVTLAPPAPPKQEAMREEAPPPPAEDKPDVQPDLFQPDFGAAAGAGDIAVNIDIGGITRSESAQEMIFDSVDLDQAPTPLVQVPPEYPYRAREQNIEGYVAVKFLVRPDGTVGNVNILKGQPEGVFDDEVRQALFRWKFQPGRLGGEAVASWVVTTLRFDLH